MVAVSLKKKKNFFFFFFFFSFFFFFFIFFFFQAEDGIRDLVRSRGLGDVYKRQMLGILLGRVKIAGISLGATFILFVGILFGELGMLSLIHI